MDIDKIIDESIRIVFKSGFVLNMLIAIAICFVLFILIVKFGSWLSKNESKIIGALGEKRVGNALGTLSKIGVTGKILQNVYIPKSDGTTTEIDILYITEKGIFVIESKNYSGWIFGNEKDYYWTMSLPNGRKDSFYNPVKQNNGHIRYLKEYLAQDIPMFSFIVFSDRCELKKITVNSNNISIIQRKELIDEVKRVFDFHNNVFTEKETEELFLKLKDLTQVDNAVKQRHIETIKRKTEAGFTDNKTDDLNDTYICPKCGSPLVLRQTKKGKNAGKEFYGCSSFPKCRYIKNL